MLLNYLIGKVKVAEYGCWLWKGAISSSGYGSTYYDGRYTTAHRVAYCLAHNLQLKDIEDYVVRHSCDTPLCCNPVHLLLGSDAQNAQDKVDRGRSGKGSKNPSAKLSDEQVAEIRTSLRNATMLAKTYGVSISMISLIKNNKRWKN